jgi:hypothetical protein
MTALAGGLTGQGVSGPYYWDAGKSPLGAELISTTSGQVANVHFYKNEGWYATGSVYEEWISSPLPSFTPPSGHTLTFVQFIVLQ